MDLVTAYGLGLASAASPCLIPLYPAFLAFLTGSAGVDAGSGEARRISGFLGLAVLCGLLTSMLLVGLLVLAASVPMSEILGYAVPLIDLILISLGITLLAGLNPFMKLPQVRVPGRRGHLSQAYVYGFFLGPLALPCAGPFLIALLAIAVGAVGSAGAVATFFVYGLGFGLPLLLLSVLARARQDTVVRFLARKHGPSRSSPAGCSSLPAATTSGSTGTPSPSRSASAEAARQARPASRALGHSDRSSPGRSPASCSRSGP